MKSLVGLFSVGVVLMTAACSAHDAGNGQPGSSRVGADSGATVTMTDFGKLRWLDGSWRGTLPKGGYFYERYEFVDDSTITMHGYADSTFSAANDSAQIVFRGNKVYDRGVSAEWIASRVDEKSIEFSPVKNASNSFVWNPVSNDQWTATLKSANGISTNYDMQRVKPAR
jgi:hypothetical protein